MKVITHPDEMRSWSRKRLRKGQTIGFVPTMGALHQGHLALVRRSQKNNDATVVSIYVNPLQFGPSEDFKQYPRTLEDDLTLLKIEKVQAVFIPSDQEMYPEELSTLLEVKGPLVRGLCAPYRPGHFNGVATVVVKLLGAVEPTSLFLGQKDAQQAAVLKAVIRDLNIGVRVEVCPIVREHDGLAMSSRNKRLTIEGRNAAPTLYRALKVGQSIVNLGESGTAKVLGEVKKIIREQKRIKIQYLEAVDPETLQPASRLKSGTLIALAAYLDNVRLIDNIVV